MKNKSRVRDECRYFLRKRPHNGVLESGRARTHLRLARALIGLANCCGEDEALRRKPQDKSEGPPPLPRDGDPSLPVSECLSDSPFANNYASLPTSAGMSNYKQRFLLNFL